MAGNGRRHDALGSVPEGAQLQSRRGSTSPEPAGATKVGEHYWSAQWTGGQAPARDDRGQQGTGED